MHIPIAREGFPFIALGLAGTVIFIWSGLPAAWGAASLFTLFAASFFRDPERRSPAGEGVILAPADGKILLIEDELDGPFSKARKIKISIFMSIFNCHINRIPLSGKIAKVLYQPGKFHAANKKLASAQNEQNALLVSREDGQEVTVVQVAGLIARRIACRVKPGDTVRRGERFGMIRFGSRVDLYVPISFRLRIKRGDKVKAGLTIMGELP
jgi:phosphatidylserine decarboxylase